MKRLFTLLLAVLLCLSLCACGKSKAAQAVDDQIAAIGKVSLRSESAIAEAEDAMAALTADERDTLENAAVLEQAREDYDRLVLEKAASDIDDAIAAIGDVTADSSAAVEEARALYETASAEVQDLVTKADDLAAAEQALLALRAGAVEELINAIGEVTLDSQTSITAAAEALAGLSPEEAALVTNANLVSEAQTALNGLQIQQATALIDAIGEVTTDSKPLIDEAQSYMDTLTAEVAGQVTNASVLADAHEQLKAAQQAYLERRLSALTLQEDRVRGLKFYYPTTLYFYSDGWGADVRCFALPYLGMDNSGNVWLRLLCNYTEDDWVFFKNITFSVDGNNSYRFFNYYDVVRDNAYGDVWEYVDMEVGDSEVELLWSIANSEETIVRFEGDDYYYDFTVDSKDKAAIREMLTVYEALQNQ